MKVDGNLDRRESDLSEGRFLRVYSFLILFSILFSLVLFKAIFWSLIIFLFGSLYLYYIISVSLKKKRVPYGLIFHGPLFLVFSAGLMIFFEYLSQIEGIRSLSIFAYIFTYNYSWNPVTNAVGVAWLGRGQIASVIGIFLFFSILSFYEAAYRIVNEYFKSNIDKRVFFSIIALLLLGGILGAWYNTFPREELILPPDLSMEEQAFKIDVGFPLFGFYELEILRLHGIDNAAWYDRNEHGPIVVKTTPDKIAKVNFGWAPIEPAPEMDNIAPKKPNKSILQIIPKMLYSQFLYSEIWIPMLLIPLFYYARYPKSQVLEKFSLSKRLPIIILVALLIVTSLRSFPVTLTFEEGLARDDYSSFLEKHEYFSPNSLIYMSYPGGSGTAGSSRNEAVIFPNEEIREKELRESQRYYNNITDFKLIHRIKTVNGNAPTVYALYLWLLPHVSAWSKGYKHLLTILIIFAIIRLVEKNNNRKQAMEAHT